MQEDGFHDECGVFGVFNSTESSKLAYLGLHALQHRGQESAGIASADEEQLYLHRALGLVQDAFNSETLEKLPGHAAIGHVRYSTAGENHIKNAQPVAVDYSKGSIAVAHNGNLTNAMALRDELERDGSIFRSSSDTEVVVHLIARSKQPTTADRLADALNQVQGAFSLVALTPTEMIAVRDPRGFRPLCLGKLGDAYVVASESPSFDLIDAQFIRDVEPGEMIVIDEKGMHSIRPFADKDRKLCVFEYIYFARPDSFFDGISVYSTRKALGRVLYEEQPAEVDVVIPVPDSGVAAAIGYAEAANTPFEMGLIRSHYVGRTFIEPQQSIRDFGVRLKLSPVRNFIEGQRVVIVDDSIVRGTTSRKIVRMVKEAGATEVHLRISSPPTKWPCFYGIDTPSRKELIAANQSVDEICTYVGADSLGFLSIEGTLNTVGNQGFCDACFSGNYPVPVTQHEKRKRQLTLL